MSLKEKAKTADQIAEMVHVYRTRQSYKGIPFPVCDELWVRLEDAEEEIAKLQTRLKEEGQKKKNVCPKIDVCQERISEYKFRTKCIGNPNDCHLNWKRPKQWLKELTVGK